MLYLKHFGYSTGINCNFFQNYMLYNLLFVYYCFFLIMMIMMREYRTHEMDRLEINVLTKFKIIKLFFE